MHRVRTCAEEYEHISALMKHIKPLQHRSNESFPRNFFGSGRHKDGGFFFIIRLKLLAVSFSSG